MTKWINKGQFKNWVITVGQIGGVLFGFMAYQFLGDLSDYRFWLFTSLSLVFGYGFSWAGLMQKWGYRPFTNDPLGWRSAKASYEPKNDEQKDSLDGRG
jgi:fatty-acid desaturase